MKTIRGDILDVSSGVIAHAVSDGGILDGGLTRQLIKKYPEAAEPYELYCKALTNTPTDKLGDVITVSVTPELSVAHLFCIHDSKTKKQFEYMALKSCLSNLAKNMFMQHSDEEIYFPYKMGCGILGGDWNSVERMIKEIIGRKAVICVLDTSDKPIKK